MSYQTILFVIQALPRGCETVDRYSTIIGAPFKGEARRPGVIVDAFNEFWGSAYVDVNEPEGGWPTPIEAALQASRQADDTSSTNQDHEDESDLRSDQSLPQETISEPSGEALSRREVKLDKTTGITVVEHPIQPSPGDATAICESPSTPRKERRTHVSTPPRRQRTNSSPKTLRALGSEPRSPLTERRKRNIPPPSYFTSPTPKVSDKENVSPKPLQDLFASVLGKRKMEPTIEDSTSYVKRKINSSRSLKTARTAGDSAVTASEGLTEEEACDRVPKTPSRKRKSEVFVGVVVPTVKEVMLRRRHSAPLKEVADSQPDGRPTCTSATALRKSRSSTRMNVVDHRNRDELEASPRKKIRTVRSGEPKPPMADFPVAGSGKAPAGFHLSNEFETDDINYCWWI